MENENFAYLIWGIIKAIFVFLFRLLMLVPMVILAVIAAALGAGEDSIMGAIIKIIKHPFIALIEAISQIMYEIKVYRDNK